MRPLPWILAAALTVSSCAGRDKKGATAPSPPPSTGIDEAALDPGVAPCEDFYQFACGGWMAKTEIPGDKPAWFRSFSEIDQRNEKLLRQILDDAAAGKAAPGGAPYYDKIGAFYAACMAEDRIEAGALPELKSRLEKIDEISSVGELPKVLAQLHLHVGSPMFAFGSQQDMRDATQVIGVVDQGGLGLPDRDYYLQHDDKSKEIRRAYTKHVQTMLTLAGAPKGKVAAQARVILAIERSLAEASLSRVDRRDPKKLYHRIELAGLTKKAPRFGWTAYLKELGHPELSQINVAVPDFFVSFNKLLGKVSLQDWRTYLKWHLIHGAAPYLSKAFVQENFAFYDQVLAGTSELPPRWKRCVEATDAALGEALARPFVQRSFGADGKAAVKEMVKQIEASMQENLSKLAWMDAPTREAALEKLHRVHNKIGFPDQWRNYDQLKIDGASFLQDVLRANEFEVHRQLAKIGKPVDRDEWFMTPPSVNAYYEPLLNEMVFPAGILQPPFFDRAAVPAVNYGAIGMVMGHELTHGFDDEGRQFAANGNLQDWWTPAASEEFDRRAQCVADQYDGYVAIDDQHVNGKLTLGENIADLGGIALAYRAWSSSRASAPGTKPPGSRFTEEQLFFLGYAQAWCSERRDAYARMRVLTDPHSPPQHRVNGPLSNLSQFAAAFECKPESKMVSKNSCQVW